MVTGDGLAAVPGRGGALVATYEHHDLRVARPAKAKEIDAVFGAPAVVGGLVRRDLKLVILDPGVGFLKLFECRRGGVFSAERGGRRRGSQGQAGGQPRARADTVRKQ